MEPFFILLVVVLVGIIVILIRMNRRAIEQKTATIAELTAKVADVEGQRNEAHRKIKENKRLHHRALMNLQEKLGEYKQVRNEVEREASQRVEEARTALAQEVNRRLSCEEENGSLRTQNEVLQSQREAAIRTLAETLQPDRIRCNKVPIYTREDAEWWSEQKTIELGAEMIPYKCDICPRYIVTGERIYHIANKDPERRTLTRRKGKAPLSTAYDTPIEVTPALIAQLRNKHGH